MALRLSRGRRSNLRSRREPLGWPRGRGGAAHDQARGEHDFARGGTAAFQPLYRQVDGLGGLLACVLADRGEVHVGEPGQHAVVVPDHRDRTGHLHAPPDERVQEPDGAAVVGRDHSDNYRLKRFESNVLHPHNIVYNPGTMERLATEISATHVGAEMDPSHLFWQGIDPVAAIRHLGDLVYHAAAKDTRINERNCRVYGVLDDRFARIPAGENPVGLGGKNTLTRWPTDSSWDFVAVGRGHDQDFWLGSARRWPRSIRRWP